MFALLACFALAGIVRAEVQGVLARGQGERLWIARTDKNDKNQTLTSVRRLVDPVRGTWAEMYRLAGGFADAAVLDERVALLSEDGSWQVVWQGGSLSGPSPGEDRKLRRIASNGYDTLFGIVTQPGKIGDLMRWTENDGWSFVATLPDEADLPDVSLGVFNGRPWLACGDEKSIKILRFEPEGGGAWQRVYASGGLGLPHPQAWVSGATRPTLVSRSADKQFELHRIEPTGQLVRLNPLPADSWAWTAAGPSVRVISVQGERLAMTTIDRYGGGASFGPEPIADPAPTLPESRTEWLNTLLLVGLTVAMLRAMGNDQPELPAAIQNGWRPAPLWRRTLAGLFDALPVILSSAWIAYRYEHPLNEEAVRLMVYLPMYIGSLVYIGHVTAMELAFGRSVGKFIFGLKVVSEDGTPVTVGQVIVRNVIRLLEWPLLLPLFLPLFTPHRQRVGDLASKTLVVLKDQQPVEPSK